MACPFFSPTERAHDIAFPHPARLPLGAAWRGTCEAPGCGTAELNSQEVESCNLGYAKSCPRLPQQRTCDAVRFGVVKESSPRITLQYVLESAHQPTECGVLEYDRGACVWLSVHSDSRIQKMADCFLQSYFERRSR